MIDPSEITSPVVLGPTYCAQSFVFAPVRTNGVGTTLSLHPRVDKEGTLHSDTLLSHSFLSEGDPE